MFVYKPLDLPMMGTLIFRSLIDSENREAMDTNSSRALVHAPSSVQAARTETSGTCATGLGKRRKWALALVAVLAAGGLLLGSMWPGFTAILPFLYVLPCLLMLAMCMRKGNSSQGS